MKVCILTLGCKVNQYESNQIAAKYITEGHTVTQKFEPADLFIVNTCAVTSFAEKKSRYQVSHIRRNFAQAEIIVCGCAGDRDINNSVCNFHAIQPRKRAFVKVQDGCNNFCSYCIVPYLRGRSKSRKTADIITEIKAANKPIVLTGIDLSSFGLDNGSSLSALCSEVNKCNLPFELSSIEVRVITQDFLQNLKTCKNFLPKFHLPLQSASNNVLKTMNRPYSAEQYADAVGLIRNFFPEAVISADIIVGFPTETEDDFNKTYEFVNKIKFFKLHIFPYSKRAGTNAETLGELQPSVVTERTQKLTKAASR